MPQAPVLVVGAGPSGLNLALALVRRNVQCRLLSDADGPGEESRAMVVQARTLEFYGQYGFAEEVIEQGVVAETAHVREGNPVAVEKFSQSVSKKWALASARIHSHSLIHRTITNDS